MQAVDGHTVTIHYRGTLDDGEEFDSSFGHDPLTFVLGKGEVIPGFDDAVRGLEAGDHASFRITAEDAYGRHDPSLILSLPAEGAPVGLVAGNIVSLQDGRMATVVEATPELIRIDTNHPLAGKALNFQIEVLAVR